MDKESLLILGATLIVTIAIVAGACFWHLVSLDSPVGISVPEPTLNVGSSAKNPLDAAVGVRSARRADGLISCPRPDGSLGFTDAASCEEARWDDSFSVVDSVRAQPRPDGAQGQPTGPRASPGSSRPTRRCETETSLHLAGISPPRGTPQRCKFPLGRALEIERMLSAADDPADSIWKEKYCEYIREARRKECEIPQGYFCYVDVCARRQ